MRVPQKAAASACILDLSTLESSRMRLLKSAFQKGDSVRGGDLPIGSPPPFRVGESEGQKERQEIETTGRSGKSTRSVPEDRGRQEQKVQLDEAPRQISRYFRCTS